MLTFKGVYAACQVLHTRGMNILVAYYEALLPFSTVSVFWLAMFIEELGSLIRGFTKMVSGVTKPLGENTSDESGKGRPQLRMRSSREHLSGNIVQAPDTKEPHLQPPVDAETKFENNIASSSTKSYSNGQGRTQKPRTPVKESGPMEAKPAQRGPLYSDVLKKPATDKKVEERNVRTTRERKPESDLQRLDKANVENSQLRSRVADAEEKYTIVERELIQANEKNETGQKTVLRLEQEVTRLQQESTEGKRNFEMQLQSVIKQSDIRKQEVERVNAELEKERALRRQEHTLLELRMRELQDTRAYLTTEDAISGEEVKGMTEALNTEIYQVAALMVDTLDFDGTFPGDEQAQAAAVRCIGKPLVSTLSAGAPRDDSEEETRHLATLAAIQASLAQSSSFLIRAWTFSPDVSNHFTRLYANIRRTCTPAVAGRWRAMTRARCKYLESDLKVEEYLTRVLLEDMIPVLVVAGWRPSPVIQMGDATGFLGQRFGTRLGEVAKKLVRLDRAMGEGLISKDVAAGWIPGGTPFNPSIMENAFGKSSGVSAEDYVLSTCDLGLVLMQVIKDREGAGSNTEVESQVLLKPKVVLFSALEHK
ncbi:uncharacterized protein BT62DRAFT_992067 [Guyanagaster necrorhizus]|uniref:Uncharacterized protein n=1 Tax=Guyanagaster necrorhizus TaxID=856835 RepID=A0A9P7VZL0_9AGAR|nr:uncharacterized protein BT62DRAFT_992067 [Guyanagaster necrorhizus MCA 3950]KAG7450058.1 hypothetical protein BT62DRAFT_992067 [Guyanagaster necrorhizus MCA 3950]